MKTIIKPCLVPWTIGATMDGLTLHHAKDNDAYCSVVFGGGRLRDDGLVDDRRIEIKFSSADFVRISPKGDSEEPEDIGFDVLDRYDGNMHQFLDWLRDRWRETGVSPYSGFYVATRSTWLSEVQEQRRWQLANELRHYVLVGRDNYIELLAKDFAWREWMWLFPAHREQFTDPNDVVGSGEGIE